MEHGKKIDDRRVKSADGGDDLAGSLCVVTVRGSGICIIHSSFSNLNNERKRKEKEKKREVGGEKARRQEGRKPRRRERERWRKGSKCQEMVCSVIPDIVSSRAVHWILNNVGGQRTTCNPYPQAHNLN